MSQNDSLKYESPQGDLLVEIGSAKIRQTNPEISAVQPLSQLSHFDSLNESNESKHLGVVMGRKLLTRAFSRTWFYQNRFSRSKVIKEKDKHLDKQERKSLKTCESHNGCYQSIYS